MRPDKTTDLVVSFVGHSAGGILATHFAVSQNIANPIPNVRLDKVISVAGRLKVVSATGLRKCSANLVNRIDDIYAGIKGHPEVNLFSFYPQKDWDWIVPKAASDVVDEQHSNPIKNVSHMSILFANQTLDRIVSLLKA